MLLLPSGLGYLTVHVSTIIITVPHSFPYLLFLLLSLPGALLPCLMQHVLTKGPVAEQSARLSYLKDET